MKYSKIRSPLLIISFCFLFCDQTPTNPKIEPVHSDLLNQDGNFVLYVSNQSYDINPVDIFIKIDNSPVIHKYFDVGNQHNCHTYKLLLPPGKHDLEVSSQKGNAILDTSFTVTDSNWACIDYWFYSNKHYNPTPRHFSFDINDKPFLFQ